ncbi:hypothetical protein [Amycolatopsis sp. NPDC059657]|uniref:hypothetical protein n=1 Tax=Amycolatopsis sp. NPDC059657 TaxID=3346899 RepID=UPI00366AAB09
MSYPPQQPPGWGQQPQQRPWPGYGYQQQPPPKKKRTGLWISLSVVFALLATGIPLGLFAMDYFASVGVAANSPSPRGECMVKTEGLLERLYTPTPTGPSEEASVGIGENAGKRYGCSWRPMKSEHVHDRQLSVIVFKYPRPDVAQGDFKLRVSPYKKQLTIPGIGEDSILESLDTDSSFSGAELMFVKGTYYVDIIYKGWDKTFFSTEPIPSDESMAAVKDVANDLLVERVR